MQQPIFPKRSYRNIYAFWTGYILAAVVLIAIGVNTLIGPHSLFWAILAALGTVVGAFMLLVAFVIYSLDRL